MIDIALVGPSFPYRGGIAHFNTRLTQALAGRARVLPIDWSPRSGAWIRGPWIEPGNQSTPYDGRLELAFGDPPTWRRVCSRLRSEGPRRLVMHWVHPWCAPAYLALIRAARQTGASVELIVHNAIPHEKRRIGALMTRLVVGRADRAISHSEWDARVLRRWCPKVRVDAAFHPIYDQFRSDRIDAPLTERLGQLGRPVLLFFGFIRPVQRTGSGHSGDASGAGRVASCDLADCRRIPESAIVEASCRKGHVTSSSAWIESACPLGGSVHSKR